MTELESLIREIPDFPKPGILFRDITPLLKDPAGFRLCIERMSDMLREVPCDLIAGIEARGFLFGSAIAMEMGIGFIPIRKPGKLPYKTVKQSYDLEYGTDAVEIHSDAVEKGSRVVLVDDLLATGGTMEASCKLLERLGASITLCAFVVELAALSGRDRLKGYKTESLIRFA